MLGITLIAPWETDGQGPIVLAACAGDSYLFLCPQLLPPKLGGILVLACRPFVRPFVTLLVAGKLKIHNCYEIWRCNASSTALLLFPHLFKKTHIERGIFCDRQ